MSQLPTQTTARSGRWAILVAACISLALAGCEEDPISKYDAPKAPPLPSWANEDIPRLRMLTAIVPHGDQVWFFKLLGTDAAVSGLTGPFEQFVRSIEFTLDAKNPVTWKLPAGWQQLPASENRYATIRMRANGQPAEMTVSSLSREAPVASNVLANVHRWRQQLGYQGAALAPDQLERFAFEHMMPCGKVTIVDLVSVPLNLAGRDAPAERELPPAPAEPAGGPGGGLPKIAYDLPTGWQPSERPAQMALITLSTSAEQPSATVTISPMPGAAGGLLANVNRWRGQVGLDPIELKDVNEVARKIKIDGNQALYFKMMGERASTGAAEPPKSILAVILPRQGVSWFIKLAGNANVAAEQEGAFVKFVESIRFKEEVPASGATP